MSLRCAVAQPDGREDLAAAVASYERSALSDRQKVALRLADAFLTDPRRLSSDVAAQARSCFSATQTIELTLKLVAFGANKAHVALGVDGPASPHGLSLLRYENGVAVVTPL